MKKNTFFILIPVSLFFFGFVFYYFFVDTLLISEITGKTQSAKANIFINLFDFDTGLTRYDVYHINKKSDYWNKRMREVQSISDMKERERANDELVAEMLQDPSLKKITRKFSAFGAKSAGNLLQILPFLFTQS